MGGGLDTTVKVGSDREPFASTFEVVVPPGYDVGAHVHRHTDEVFYVLEGRLDVLAFEPVDRSVPDWHAWESADGQRYLSGGPGAFLYVQPGVPHAFTSGTTIRVFFQSSRAEATRIPQRSPIYAAATTSSSSPVCAPGADPGWRCPSTAPTASVGRPTPSGPHPSYSAPSSLARRRCGGWS